MTPAIPFLDELVDARDRLSQAKVLYTDLDGTLLGRGACLLADGSGTPTLDGAEAVARLNAAGLTVVICSGRNAKQLMEVTRLLGWRDFIGEIGAVRSYDRASRRVLDTGAWDTSMLRRGETPYAAIVRVGAFARLETAFPGLIEYHDPWHKDREVTHVLRGNIPLAHARTVLEDLELPVDLLDNGIIHPPHHCLTCDEIHAYHLVPRGISKQAGIAADLLERGLTPDEAIAIGDSATDIDMSEAVGTMFVVRNGLDDEVLVERASGEPFVAALRGRHGAGWRELADAWLAAAAS